MSDLAPITSNWARIRQEATREGYAMENADDLVAYNKHRMHRGLAPYAVAWGVTGRARKGTSLDWADDVGVGR